MTTLNSILSNLTATISDHPTQFLIAPDILSYLCSAKSNTVERDAFKFVQEHFILDYLSLDLENLMISGNINVSHSFVNFLAKSN